MVGALAPEAATDAVHDRIDDLFAAASPTPGAVALEP
jgi:hypothetical protein